MQIGGGINLENAKYWLENGAQKVIVTSFLFPDGKFNLDRLSKLSLVVEKEKLVIDLRYFLDLKL